MTVFAIFFYIDASKKKHIHFFAFYFIFNLGVDIRIFKEKRLITTDAWFWLKCKENKQSNILMTEGMKEGYGVSRQL